MWAITVFSYRNIVVSHLFIGFEFFMLFLVVSAICEDKVVGNINVLAIS